MISVIQLGTIDYATGLRLQRKLVDLRKENRIGDVLLMLEHTPVITLGRNAKAANILRPASQLRQRGVEVFECDRGGDVTFHGPGQIVGYPIFDLRGPLRAEPGLQEEGRAHQTLGVIEYVRRLEEVLIRTCADFRIATDRVPGLTGVWTSINENIDAKESSGLLNRGQSSQAAKIAAIGVHISRGVTSHGFALNVNTDLNYFNLIVPCGIVDKPVTSMAMELGQALRLDDVARALVHNFGTVFESQIFWLKSLEGLLGEQADVPAKPPEQLRRLHGEEDIFWA